MARTTPYQRRTTPRWPRPVFRGLALVCVLGGLAFAVYARLQGAERMFTHAPELPDTASLPNISNPVLFSPPSARGDWVVRATLPLHRLEGAMAAIIPLELARLDAVQRVTPGWLGTSVAMPVSATIVPAAAAQIIVFDQAAEVIQPLRLTFSAEIRRERQTKTHDFVLTARYGFDIDQDWHLTLVELEPARLQGFMPPPLFGSIDPDLTPLVQQVTTTARQMRGTLIDILNGGQDGQGLGDRGLRAQMADFAATFSVPDGNGMVPVQIRSAHVNAVRLDAAAVQMELVLDVQAASQNASPNLPTLNSVPRDVGDFQIPVGFFAPMTDLQAILQQNQRVLSLAGGHMQAKSFEILGPVGDRLLIRVAADQIDPGQPRTHGIKKRGIFHILAQVGFHGPTQSLRFTNATMPSPQRPLGFWIRGRNWLQSDAVAAGLIGGLDGLARQDQVVAYLDALHDALDGPRDVGGVQAKQTLGPIRFSNAPTAYHADGITAYVIAQVRPGLQLSL